MKHQLLPLLTWIVHTMTHLSELVAIAIASYNVPVHTNVKLGGRCAGIVESAASFSLLVRSYMESSSA